MTVEARLTIPGPRNFQCPPLFNKVCGPSFTTDDLAFLRLGAPLVRLIVAMGKEALVSWLRLLILLCQFVGLSHYLGAEYTEVANH